MTKTVSFKVGMTCGGCKGAVTRILTKIEGTAVSMEWLHSTSQPVKFLTLKLLHIGVTEVKADVDEKTVDVVCEDDVDGEVLHSALRNWGEKAGKSVELVVAA